MLKWTITALNAGTSEIDKSLATYLVDMGKKIKVPNIIFLIEGEERIVVDTSFESVEKTKRINRQNVWMSEEQKPISLFNKIKVDSKKIKIVVHTHLHYDHCGNDYLFSKARFIVQRKELQYALAPNPGQETLFHSPLIGEQPGFLGVNLEIINGDRGIVDGVSVITVPGHTPGSQAVLVDTVNGVYCIAGDAAVLYENLGKGLPVGLHECVNDCFDSVEKMKQKADYIIPGHDSRIFAEEPIVKWPGSLAYSTKIGMLSR